MALSTASSAAAVTINSTAYTNIQRWMEDRRLLSIMARAYVASFEDLAGVFTILLQFVKVGYAGSNFPEHGACHFVTTRPQRID